MTLTDSGRQAAVPGHVTDGRERKDYTIDDALSVVHSFDSCLFPFLVL